MNFKKVEMKMKSYIIAALGTIIFLEKFGSYGEVLLLLLLLLSLLLLLLLLFRE